MSNKRIKLVRTCGACPEQYDAYVDGENLGYLRLRHGCFRAEYRGMVVFTGYPNGDGCFDVQERDRWLNEACIAILKAHDNMGSSAELAFEFGTEDDVDSEN